MYNAKTHTKAAFAYTTTYTHTHTKTAMLWSHFIGHPMHKTVLLFMHPHKPPAPLYIIWQLQTHNGQSTKTQSKYNTEADVGDSHTEMYVTCSIHIIRALVQNQIHSKPDSLQIAMITCALYYQSSHQFPIGADENTWPTVGAFAPHAFQGTRCSCMCRHMGQKRPLVTDGSASMCAVHTQQ